jgi:hypothetical protein
MGAIYEYQAIFDMGEPSKLSGTHPHYDWSCPASAETFVCGIFASRKNNFRCNFEWPERHYRWRLVSMEELAHKFARVILVDYSEVILLEAVAEICYISKPNSTSVLCAQRSQPFWMKSGNWV